MPLIEDERVGGRAVAEGGGCEDVEEGAVGDRGGAAVAVVAGETDDRVLVGVFAADDDAAGAGDGAEESVAEGGEFAGGEDATGADVNAARSPGGSEGVVLHGGVIEIDGRAVGNGNSVNKSIRLGVAGEEIHGSAVDDEVDVLDGVGAQGSTAGDVDESEAAAREMVHGQAGAGSDGESVVVAGHHQGRGDFVIAGIDDNAGGRGQN